MAETIEIGGDEIAASRAGQRADMPNKDVRMDLRSYRLFMKIFRISPGAAAPPRTLQRLRNGAPEKAGVLAANETQP